jgi:hypothetical protein
VFIQPVGNGNEVMMKMFHDQSNPVMRMVRECIYMYVSLTMWDMLDFRGSGSGGITGASKLLS